jgi:hypothetical protein
MSRASFAYSPIPGTKVATRWWASAIQLGSVEDELAFLFEVVSDQVLLEAIVPMREMIRRATHEPRAWSLLVETP